MCFHQETENGLAIIAVYVNDLNLIGTPEELIKTANYLKKEFEIKDLRKTRYRLGLQIEYCLNGVLIHQSSYTKKSLSAFIWINHTPFVPPWLLGHLQ